MACSSMVGRMSDMASLSENPPWGSLLPYQRQAVAHMQALAARVSAGAREHINAVLTRAGLHESVYDDAIESVRAHARVGLHFHPERLSRTRRTVAEGLLQTGVYQSQFETGLSSGSPSAFRGGGRDPWGGRLFGGGHHGADPAASPRPEEGAPRVMLLSY